MCTEMEAEVKLTIANKYICATDETINSHNVVAIEMCMYRV